MFNPTTIGWGVGGGGVERSDQQERKEEDEGKSWQLYAGCALVGPEYFGGVGLQQYMRTQV